MGLEASRIFRVRVTQKMCVIKDRKLAYDKTYVTFGNYQKIEKKTSLQVDFTLKTFGDTFLPLKNSFEFWMILFTL